jgi:hypothetical protein
LQIWVELNLRFYGTSDNDERVFPMRPTGLVLTDMPNQDEFERWLSVLEKDILARVEKLTQKSNLVFKKVDGAGLLMCDYNPLRSGRSYAELSAYLVSKKAIVNVQNRDERCFGYALLSWLLYDEV